MNDADQDDVEPLDPEHAAAVLEGLDQARRGQFAEPDAVKAAFARFEK